jgi:tetratricopeptide (TPR) repeat protein
MKPFPEIDPEIRGLLEEIVADPRSSIRLVPRRPLLSWFTSGETVRPREISATSAERHLLMAYREELARLLYEAGAIAYWKAAECMHRPLDSSGKPSHPTRQEPEWHRDATRRLMISTQLPESLELLRKCLVGIEARDALPVLQASLGLVPSDQTRCYVAISIPEEQPRSAIAAFGRLLSSSYPRSLRLHVLHSLGIRLALVGRYHEAREYYRQASALDSGQVGRSYSFNLSCVLEDELGAMADSAELGRCASRDSIRVTEAKAIISRWLRSDPRRKNPGAVRLADRLVTKVSEPAAILCQAYAS